MLAIEIPFGQKTGSTLIEGEGFGGNPFDYEVHSELANYHEGFMGEVWIRPSGTTEPWAQYNIIGGFGDRTVQQYVCSEKVAAIRMNSLPSNDADVS